MLTTNTNNTVGNLTDAADPSDSKAGNVKQKLNEKELNAKKHMSFSDLDDFEQPFTVEKVCL